MDAAPASSKHKGCLLPAHLGGFLYTAGSDDVSWKCYYCILYLATTDQTYSPCRQLAIGRMTSRDSHNILTLIPFFFEAPISRWWHFAF